jgi:hypothetical protein
MAGGELLSDRAGIKSTLCAVKQGYVMPIRSRLIRREDKDMEHSAFMD